MDNARCANGTAESVTRPDISDLRIDPEAKRGRRSRWPVAVAAVAAVAVVLVLLWWWLAERAVAVEIVSARAADAETERTVLDASGYVTPRRRATVSAKVTGKLEEVLVEEGDEVAEGQIVAHLDDADAQAQLAAARAELEVARAALVELEVELDDARRTLRRVRGLHRDGVASEEELDRAETAEAARVAALALARRRVEATQAAVAVADRAVENHVVRAPFAGIVVSKDAQGGEMVSPVSAGGGYTRTGIATIVDMDSLEIEVDVNESYIARVEPGQPVEATLDAYPEWRIPASVITVIPTADRQKATVRVRIAFAALDPRILPDMGVRVAFREEADEDQRQAREGVLIPHSALVTDGGTSFVYVVGPEERVERRAVSAASSEGDEAQVRAGLRPGEQIVADPPSTLADGTPVRVR